MSWQERSKKIKTLFHEGYPPKQAAAIAYKMFSEVDPEPSERARELMAEIAALQVGEDGERKPLYDKKDLPRLRKLEDELADALAGNPGGSKRPATAGQRTVYAVYARSNGKPAGFVGRYKTRGEAETSDWVRRHGGRIKRERVSTAAFEAWLAAGAPSRVWPGEPKGTAGIGPSDPLGWMKATHGKFDVSFEDGRYIPTARVLGNREEGRQREELQAIGERLFGNQFASEPDYDRGGLWATYRDNRDVVEWRKRNDQLASAFEKAGYKVKRYDDGEVTAIYDKKAIERAIAIHELYVAWLNEQRSSARSASARKPGQQRQVGAGGRVRNRGEELLVLADVQLLDRLGGPPKFGAAGLRSWSLPGGVTIDTYGHLTGTSVLNAKGTEKAIVALFGKDRVVTAKQRASVDAQELDAILTKMIAGQPVQWPAVSLKRRREATAKAEAAIEVARVKLEEAGVVVAASSGKAKTRAQQARERAAIALVKAEQKLLRVKEDPPKWY